MGNLYVGTTSIGARKLSDVKEGTVRKVTVAMNGRGKTVIGQLGGRPGDGGDEDIAFVSRALNGAGFETDVVDEDEVTKAVWVKMLVNCLVNPGCAVRGVTNGEAVLDPKLVEEVRVLATSPAALFAASVWGFCVS